MGLSPSEKDNLARCARHLHAKFHQHAHLGRRACFSLSQACRLGEGENNYACMTTSNATKLPCFTKSSSTRMMMPYVGRWITVRETFAMQGLPVFEDLAKAVGVPVMKTYSAHGHEQSGNQYNAINWGCVFPALLLSA